MSDPILDALQQAERSSIQIQEPIRRASDLIQHARVLDPAGSDLQQMERWPLHVELMDEFWTQDRTIINKARQMGVSWAFALDCLHHLGWNKFRTLGSVNYNQEVAGELIYRMSVLWHSLPAGLRPPIRGEWGRSHVEFANGSRAIALATTNVAGAGYSFSRLGIDEAGLIKNLGDNWPALLPAVDKGQLHAFSTPREDTGKHAELVSAARKGEGRFKLREIQFWERPDRDQNTEQGRAWLAARKAELSPEEFDREYGLKFSRPGSCYFGDQLIADLRAQCREPLDVLWGGKLKIWIPPANFNAMDASVIGADVAEGLEGGDASAANVIGRRTGIVPATYHGRIGTTEYADDLVRLGNLYGHAWLSIEANNHGHAVCQWAFKHCRYRRIYRESREAEGQIGAPSRTRLGVLTTESSKPAMLAAAEYALRKNQIAVFDAALVEELAVFRRLPGGGYGAVRPYFDDRVMSLLLSHDGRGRPFPRSI